MPRATADDNLDGFAKALEESPRWRTLGYCVGTKQLQSGKWIMTLKRRLNRHSRSPCKEERSNGAYERFYKGTFSTKEEAMRLSRQGVFSHFVTYHADGRWQKGAVDHPVFGESPQRVMKGRAPKRKKTEGMGVMVSGFVDEQRGFGCPGTAEELERVNAARDELYGPGTKPKLEASPGVRFLEYGKNKDGYWTAADMAKQLEDMIDYYECLYPGWQLIFEFDWSSGHKAHREGCLAAYKMNVSFGGKQSIPDASRLTEGCVGPQEKRKIQVDEMQHFFFRTGEENGTGVDDPPPWYAPNVSASEYLGQAKGLKQVLWERGLWVDGMVRAVGEDDDEPQRSQSMSMTHVLSECEDFRNEVTLLEEIAWRRGHIVLFTPKGHCELAGIGIEYCWGKLKKWYRRNNSPTGPADFFDLVVRSMSREVLPLTTARRFARKARAYMRAYLSGESNEHALLEAMVKRFKTHRNALDFAGKFIDSC